MDKLHIKVLIVISVLSRIQEEIAEVSEVNQSRVNTSGVISDQNSSSSDNSESVSFCNSLWEWIHEGRDRVEICVCN